MEARSWAVRDCQPGVESGLYLMSNRKSLQGSNFSEWGLATQYLLTMRAVARGTATGAGGGCGVGGEEAGEMDGFRLIRRGSLAPSEEGRQGEG